MRPVPIPDELVVGGLRRVVIAPPGGDLTHDRVAAVEVLAGVDPQLGVCQTILVQLEDGDLERLAEHPAIWLSMYTPQLPVFAIEVADGRGS